MARVIWKRYGFDYELPITSGQTADAEDWTELQSPHRTPALGADFGVPASQGLLTGILGGFAVAAVAGALGGSFGHILGPAVAVCCVAAWFWRLDIASRTLWRTDAIMTNTPAPAAAPPPPPPAPEAHGILIAPYGGQMAARSEVAERWKNELREFIRGCATGDTSVRRWEHRLGRAKYAEFRDVLLRSGHARWNHPTDTKQGWRLIEDAETVEAMIFGIPGDTFPGWLAADKIAARQMRQLPPPPPEY